MSDLLVLLLSKEYPQIKPGGISIFNQELAEGLSKENVDVTLVATSYDSIIKIFNEKGFNVICLPSPDISPRHELFQITSYKALAKIIKELGPDIINLSSNSILPSVSKATRIVSTVHGSPSYSKLRLNLGLREAFRERASNLASYLPRFLFLNKKIPVDRFAHVSNYTLKDTLASTTKEEASKYREKSVVIYNGVDPIKLRKIAKSYNDKNNDLHEKEDKDNLRVMFMGRFTRYKGVFQMITALKLVLDEMKEVRFDLYGDGPIWNDVLNQVNKLQISEKVVLHGRVPKQELLGRLSSCYAVVHPSLIEAGSVVPLEAYSFGKPVIANKAPWSSEFVEEPQAGLTASVFESKRFADAILWVLNDKVLYRKLSSKAFRAIKERFSSKVMAKRYLELYKEILF